MDAAALVERPLFGGAVVAALPPSFTVLSRCHAPARTHAA